MSVLSIPDLEAGFLLDETSGDVARNVVRTLVIDEQFTTPGSTDAYGDIAAGASRYALSLEGGGEETLVCDFVGGVLSLSMDTGATAGDYFGYQWPGVIADGDEIVVEIRYRTLSRTAPAQLAFNAGGTAYNVISNAVEGWQTKAIRATTVGTNGLFLMLANSTSGPGEISVEIDYLKVTIENAATLVGDTADNMTAAGFRGTALNFDNTDYASAPLSGGMTYPKTIACAFKLDSLTSSAARTLISLVDADDAAVYWRVAVHNLGTQFVVNRRNTTDYLQNLAAPLTTNQHSVAVVFHDATSYSVYLDGTLLTTQTGLNSVAESANVDTLLIGLLRLSSPTQYADGITIDEVFLFDRDLESYEIAKLHARGGTPQLDVGRAGNFRLEETEGLVCRNQIRTQLFSFSDFGDLGSTDAYGDITSGFNRYTNGLEGDETIVCTCDPDTGLYEINVQNGAGVTSDNIGVQKDIGIVVGRNYVVEVVGRIVSRSASATLQVNLAGGASATLASTIASELTRYTATVTAAGGSSNLFLFAGTTGDAVVEIKSIKITEENAGTPTEDLAGLTGPGISGRCVLLNGTSQAVDLPYALCQAMASVDEATVAFAFKGSEPRSAVRIQPFGTDYLITPYKSGANYYIGLSTAGGATQFNLGALSELTDGEWHTFVYTYQRNTTNGQKVYIDGAVAYQANAPDAALPAFGTNSLPARIGAYGGDTEWAAGSIDEVSLATRAWSAAEAAEYHEFAIFPLAARHSAEPLGLETSLSL